MLITTDLAAGCCGIIFLMAFFWKLDLVVWDKNLLNIVIVIEPIELINCRVKNKNKKKEQFLNSNLEKEMISTSFYIVVSGY